jgi:hypothetical protein
MNVITAIEGRRSFRQFDPNHEMTEVEESSAAIDHCHSLQEPLAGGNLFQVDQATPSNQEIPRNQRERSQDANLVRRVDLRADRHRKKRASTQCLALHIATDSFGLRF